MHVLAFDTSTACCSAAVWSDGRVLARRLAVMARGQSEALMPMIAEVMAEAGLAFADLALVGVTVGPGTFTGLRIGLAAARGIGLASGLPVAGVTSTEAVAAAIAADERAGRTVVVALDAKRVELCVQAFDPDLRPLGPPQALAPDDAGVLATGPVVLAGCGAARLAGVWDDALVSTAFGAPDAGVVAALAARHWRAGVALPPRPLYLRPPDVTLPAGSGA